MKGELVMNTAIISASPFDRIAKRTREGAEYWSARGLMPLMGYAKWQSFEVPLNRAMQAAANQGHDVESNFTGSRNISVTKPRQDYQLTRFACYLVAMNGDPNKPEVAAAQAYFAIQTRVAETQPAPAPALTGAELMAAALIEARETMARHAQQVRELEPRANAWDSFLGSTGDYSVNEAAKILARDKNIHIGEGRLRALLEEWRWIYRHSGQPRAMQTQIDTGRLAEKASFYYHPETGEKVAKTPQVRVTPKGIDAIAKRMHEVAA